MICMLPAMAQKKETPTFNGYHKNIFIEGLGGNLLLGVNYDMRLNRGRMDGIGFRAGVGGMSFTGTTNYGEPVTIGIVTLPLEFNHVLGKRRSSLLTGVGVIPVFASADSKGQTITADDGTKTVINQGEFGFGGAYLSLGYRFQPLRNGIMFQINWNPLINKSGFQPSWFGIGIGVGFK